MRLAQVPHWTSNREGSTLAKPKWQPPHNVGTPQTMKHRYLTIHDLLSGPGENSIYTGEAYLAARGNHGRSSRPMGNRYGPPMPNDISSNVGKPQKHLASLLLAYCREQNDTNRKYCSAASRVAELNNHYY